MLLGILEDREFRLLVRTQFLHELQKAVGVDFHLDIVPEKVTNIGGTLRFPFTFQVTADDPTDRVNLFRALVEEIDDEDDIAAQFLTLAEQSGFNAQQKTEVHPQTLKAWVREQVEDGASFPMDLFGAYIGHRATIRGK